MNTPLDIEGIKRGVIETVRLMAELDKAMSDLEVAKLDTRGLVHGEKPKAIPIEQYDVWLSVKNATDEKIKVATQVERQARQTLARYKEEHLKPLLPVHDLLVEIPSGETFRVYLSCSNDVTTAYCVFEGKDQR